MPFGEISKQSTGERGSIPAPFRQAVLTEAAIHLT